MPLTAAKERPPSGGLSRHAIAAATLFCLLLSACGDLPQPFLGYPGLNAMRLSQPPPSRLVIPPPVDSLLTDGPSRIWSGALADALLARELPVTTNRVRPGDWRLVLSAELQNGQVVPTYTVLDSKGEPQGNSQGPPVTPADWSAGQPATLKAAADAEAPRIVDLLAAIEARRQQSDPNSLLNRPPVLYFTGVTGAPGDGNVALAKQMATRLPGLGDLVQDTGKGADFSLKGEVKTAIGANKLQRIEIQWIVGDPQGRERGRVIQINEVPPGQLDQYWGEVAIVVAQEAAGGVHEVVLQASGRGSNATPNPQATAPAGKPAG